jgi:hypothetical protein
VIKERPTTMSRGEFATVSRARDGSGLDVVHRVMDCAITSALQETQPDRIVADLLDVSRGSRAALRAAYNEVESLAARFDQPELAVAMAGLHAALRVLDEPGGTGNATSSDDAAEAAAMPGRTPVASSSTGF